MKLQEEFPLPGYENVSDEEFHRALALAEASFHKYRTPEEEWDRIYIMQKPLQYWIGELEKSTETAQRKKNNG